MTSGVSKMQVLSLYKVLLRESQKISSYNFRNYALRRVKDAFKTNKMLDDPAKIKAEYKFGNENLKIIRRQAVLSDMFQTEKLVIENTR